MHSIPEILKSGGMWDGGRRRRPLHTAYYMCFHIVSVMNSLLKRYTIYGQTFGGRLYSTGAFGAFRSM